jgi:alkylated DNA repair dioxygenase AlkB
LPWHRIEQHAATCSGGVAPTAAVAAAAVGPKRRRIDPALLEPSAEPLPGLFLYEDFITEQEEAEILAQLDGTSHPETYLPWKAATFNGRHDGKRWGVHCNLRERRVDPAEHPLPPFLQDIVLDRLEQRVRPMRDRRPNEANAIDYRQKRSDYLVAHVDDRQLSKEPIANLSLAGDCYMTFTNVKMPRHATAAMPAQIRLLLKRRCLQVLTGPARYDFSHAIAANDILSERRVSITMRESPLTRNPTSTKPSATSRTTLTSLSPWSSSMPSPTSSKGFPALSSLDQPLPGLYLIPNFLSEADEALLLSQIDAPIPPLWSNVRHTGCFRQKRWGMDHDLWSPNVRTPKHALPPFFPEVLLPRLFPILRCNEANAIEYVKARGDHLTSHVDDRKKHKEAIVNLSLAGDAYMTFTNVQSQRNLAPQHKRILLPRRCLLLLTGVARYEFAHGYVLFCFWNELLLSIRLLVV